MRIVLLRVKLRKRLLGNLKLFQLISRVVSLPSVLPVRKHNHAHIEIFLQTYTFVYFDFSCSGIENVPRNVR